MNSSIKSHTVKRLYKAGSWASLNRIVCNKCTIEKDKGAYAPNRYTCRDCVTAAPAPQKEKEPTKEHLKAVDVPKKRIYKNGVWATLDTITCNDCNETKERTAFKINRYICMDCSKKHMRALNAKKGEGKYAELQKVYNARYEASPHGTQRRKEYREKLKQARTENMTRKVNPFNRLRVHIRKCISTLLKTPLKVAAAVQYLGVSQQIFKAWIEYNMLDDMTWENFGSVWTMHLVPLNIDLTTEKGKFDALNWRNWCPVNMNDTRDCRDRSVNFL
jgi:hypothetical protein